MPKAAKRRPQQPKPRRKRRQAVVQPFRLPATGDRSLHAWMRAYRDPFNSGPVGLPVAPAPPSRKFITYSKGLMTVGTAGFGFVNGYPTPSNDLVCAYVTDGTFAGTSTSTVAAGVNSATNNISPYASTTFEASGGTYEQRLVLACLRVRYIGTELNRGGRILAYTLSDHGTTDGVGVSQPLSIPGFQVGAVDRRWHSIRWAPQMPWEMAYTGQARTPIIGGGPSTYPQICVMVDSTAGNQFEFEFIQYYEILGEQASNSDSHPSRHADVVLGAANDLGRRTAKTGAIFETVKKHAPDVLEGIGAVGVGKTLWNAAKSRLPAAAEWLAGAAEEAIPYALMI